VRFDLILASNEFDSSPPLHLKPAAHSARPVPRLVLGPVPRLVLESVPRLVLESVPRLVLESVPRLVLGSVPRLVLGSVPRFVLGSVPRLVLEPVLHATSTTPVRQSIVENGREAHFLWM
jgi:hypothetical protein